MVREDESVNGTQEVRKASKKDGSVYDLHLILDDDLSVSSAACADSGLGPLATAAGINYKLSCEHQLTACR